MDRLPVRSLVLKSVTHGIRTSEIHEEPFIPFSVSLTGIDLSVGSNTNQDFNPPLFRIQN
jgi:hypothetical protein